MRRPSRLPLVVWAAPVAAGMLLSLAGAAPAQVLPTKGQAAAAVALYNNLRQRCAGGDAACETAAKREFVSALSCVVHGRSGANPATLATDFVGYVDLVSDILGGEEPVSTGDVGPCFAGAAAATSTPAGAVSPGAGPAPVRVPPAAAPAAASPGDGPSLEALRRFRQQGEPPSRPVTPSSTDEPPARTYALPNGMAVPCTVKPAPDFQAAVSAFTAACLAR